jgi:hydroxymethylpyrimidine/phosphomethylpyrimidine kinase
MPETRSTSTASTPSVLCIAGLDPSGGAGLAADARACKAFGALALPVATAIVVQNTRGVKLTEPIAPAVIVAQIETLLEDIRPGAIKIGMLPNAQVARMVAELLRPLHGEVPMVMDTVFAPSTGRAFNDNSAIEAIADHLLPLATIVTPNAVEARQLGALSITDLDSMKRAAVAVLKRAGAQSVLLKGGHIEDAQFAIDLFFDGSDYIQLQAPRVPGYEVRGTGCLLASALAALLARGAAPVEAVPLAKEWLTEQYLDARVIGVGGRVTAI